MVKSKGGETMEEREAQTDEGRRRRMKADSGLKAASVADDSVVRHRV